MRKKSKLRSMENVWMVFSVPEHMIFEVLSMELIMMYSILKQINVLPETTMQRLSVRKKVKNKIQLQKDLGLNEDPNAMLIGIVSRLTDQKGFDLIAYVNG